MQGFSIFNLTNTRVARHSLPIEEQQDELSRMIKGRGAFSRFRQGIARFLLEDKWYEYRDNALAELAKDWCDDNKIELNPTTNT